MRGRRPSLILAKKMNPVLVLRLAMLALLVAMLGQYYLDPAYDFARGALFGVAIGLQLLALVVMKRQRPGVG